MTTFVDTSAFYALLDADDQNHVRARSVWPFLLEQAGRLFCSNYVVVETIALLQHRLGLEAVRAFVEELLPVVQVEWVQHADHVAALSLLLSTGRRQVSFVDCTSFVVARRLGIQEVFCYDAHFGQFGFRLIGE